MTFSSIGAGTSIVGTTSIQILKEEIGRERGNINYLDGRVVLDVASFYWVRRRLSDLAERMPYLYYDYSVTKLDTLRLLRGLGPLYFQLSIRPLHVYIHQLKFQFLPRSSSPPTLAKLLLCSGQTSCRRRGHPPYLAKKRHRSLV